MRAWPRPTDQARQSKGPPEWQDAGCGDRAASCAVPARFGFSGRFMIVPPLRSLRSSSSDRSRRKPGLRPGFKSERQSRLDRCESGIVGIHRGKREEIARRAGRDDVGHIARRQGDRSAGADEPFHLGVMKRRLPATRACRAASSRVRPCRGSASSLCRRRTGSRRCRLPIHVRFRGCERSRAAAWVAAEPGIRMTAEAKVRVLAADVAAGLAAGRSGRMGSAPSEPTGHRWWSRSRPRRNCSQPHRIDGDPGFRNSSRRSSRLTPQPEPPLWPKAPCRSRSVGPPTIAMAVAVTIAVIASRDRRASRAGGPSCSAMCLWASPT